MSTLLDLIHTHYRGLETGDLDLSASVHADDVVTEMPMGVLEGLEAFRALGQAFITAVPDMKLTIRQTWEVDDTIIVEGTYSGTQTGPLQSPDGNTIPASGRAFSFPFVDIYVAKDGKFVSHRGYWDNVLFFTQLGLLPEPEAATA